MMCAGREASPLAAHLPEDFALSHGNPMICGHGAVNHFGISSSTTSDDQSTDSRQDTDACSIKHMDENEEDPRSVVLLKL